MFHRENPTVPKPASSDETGGIIVPEVVTHTDNQDLIAPFCPFRPLCLCVLEILHYGSFSISSFKECVAQEIHGS
jgi:hypothetical protein